MSYKAWVYHSTEEPKIIDSDDLQHHLDSGWAESPAKFVKTTDFGIDPGDVLGVQALGETIEGIKDQLNGQLNLEEMKPKELKEYASKHFSRVIKGNREKLLTQVRGFINDNSNRDYH